MTGPEHDQKVATIRRKAMQMVALIDSAPRADGLNSQLAALIRELAELNGPGQPSGDEGRSASAWVRTLAWEALRTVVKLAPFDDGLRERAKQAFYSVYGRLFPSSEIYRRFLEYQSSVEQQIKTRASRVPVDIPLPISAGPQPFDVLIFPVIDWEFRFQRPQHLASQLANRGHRVFYFRTTFAASNADYHPAPMRLADNVFSVQLPCDLPLPVIYGEPLSRSQRETVATGLDLFRQFYRLGASVSIVQHPFWFPVAAALENNRVVYDCMDHHAGFSNVRKAILELERQYLDDASLVVVSSEQLISRLPAVSGPTVLIQNGAEYDHFAREPLDPAPTAERKVIGYYGAIAEWFDTGLVERVARAFPEHDILLIGATVGADLSRFANYPNIKLLGEVSYQSLPEYLHRFDVCMIPFKINELTLCTNPVKVYEYLSAGKPVVSVKLPELEALAPLVKIADDGDSFVQHVRESLAESSSEQISQRRAFAQKNTWDHRGEQLLGELNALFPRISIIVLTYNQLKLTRACLESLEQESAYPNWELIVVDNASSDQTPTWLQTFAKRRPHVTTILNQQNLGFSAGNNQGARAASGEYLVFLNNDTVVTRGWLGDLLSHFRQHPKLGLLGPVTNNIGNEARIEISYQDMDEMARAARSYTRVRRGQRYPLRAAAFFCVMIPRKLWDEIGPLDENFGQGFFEDDDYAMRLKAAGYDIACAEDVFVHHHLSGSFDAESAASREALFERNKAYFESKWGPWVPHRYRPRLWTS